MWLIQQRPSNRGRRCFMAAPPIATSRSLSLIAPEATAEVRFGFTSVVLRLALKPLFTILLRRSHNTLPSSTVALFCALFSDELVLSPLEASNRREARPERLPGSSADSTHSGIYAEPPQLPRRGNHSQSIRSIRSLPSARPPHRGPTPRSGGEGGHTGRLALPNPNCQNRGDTPPT